MNIAQSLRHLSPTRQKYKNFTRHNCRQKTIPTLPTLGNSIRPERKVLLDISFKASPQDGLIISFSGSFCTGSILLWKSNNTQSIIRIIRCGGLPSLRTTNTYLYCTTYYWNMVDNVHVHRA